MSIQKKIFYSALLTFLCFFIAEIVCRSVWDQDNPLVDYDMGIQMQPSISRIWEMKPGVTENFGHQVTVGEDGLRLPAGEGTVHKWMTLGDSSIFGHGLSDEGTLHHQLNQKLDNAGYKSTVFCGGVPGYSILQTELLMDDIGWGLNPNLLIIGNLWSDNNFDKFVDKVWLEDLNSTTAKLSHFMGRFRIWKWASSILKPYSAPTNLHRGGDPRITWVREPMDKGQRRVSLGDYGRTIDRLFVRAAEKDIGIIVMQPANRTRLEGVSRGVMWEPYFELQRKLALRRGIPIIDVLPSLKDKGLTVGDAFLDDMHPTKAANEIIAHDIVKLALESGWPQNPLIANGQQPIYNGQPKDPYATGLQILDSKNAH